MDQVLFFPIFSQVLFFLFSQGYKAHVAVGLVLFVPLDMYIVKLIYMRVCKLDRVNCDFGHTWFVSI